MDLARELEGADLEHIRFVTMPNFLFAEGTSGYPHVGLSPSYRELIAAACTTTSPWGRSAATPCRDGAKEHPSRVQEDAAAAAGLCA